MIVCERKANKTRTLGQIVNPPIPSVLIKELLDTTNSWIADCALHSLIPDSLTLTPGRVS
jgi:hypothetical protein